MFWSRHLKFEPHEFAVLTEHPGYNQNRGKYEMPEFLACYQKKADHPYEGQSKVSYIKRRERKESKQKCQKKAP